MRLSSLQRFALFIFFFSINFELWDPLNTNGNFSISKLTGYIYFFTIITQLPFFLNIKSFKRYIWPYLAFWGLLSVINFININNIDSQFVDITMLQNILLMIIMVNHSKKEREIIDKAMLAFAIGAFLVAIFFWFGIGVENEAGRITVFGDNQNVVGIRECVGITIILFFIIQKRLNWKKWRYMLLIALPIMFLLMIKTGSRVAFISFALIFIVLLFFIKVDNKYLKPVILGVGLIICVVVWKKISSNPSDILYSRLVNTEQNGDIGGRNNVWAEVIPFAAQHWVIGKGETGYSYFSTHAFGVPYSPHNVILEVICYTGFIGLFLYFLFLYRISKIAFKQYRMNGHLLRLLLLIPICGLLLSAQLLNVKLGYIIFAYCISAHYSVNEQRLKIRH